MTTHEIVPERRPGLAKRAIRLGIDCMVQKGVFGAGYQSKQDAQHWADRMATQDNGKT
jgi:hypothetical protein